MMEVSAGSEGGGVIDWWPSAVKERLAIFIQVAGTQICIQFEKEQKFLKVDSIKYVASFKTDVEN